MRWVLAAVNVILAVVVCLLLLREEEAPFQRFTDYRIIFLCVGDKDQPHVQPFERGVAHAENDFGCDIKVWWCNWDDQSILSAFNQAILYQPDAICLPGYEWEERFVPFVEEARGKGILVTTYHTPLYGLQRRYAAEGLGFVGEDQYKAGRALLDRGIKKFGVTEQTRVLICGNSRPRAPLRARSQGLLDGARAHGIKADFMDLLDYWQGSPRRSVSGAFQEYLASHEPPEVIFFDAGPLDDFVTALQDARIAPGAIKVAAFDCSTIGLEALRANYVQLICAHDTELQGYLTVLQACLGLERGLYGLTIRLPSEFIDESNIEELERLQRVGEAQDAA